MTRRVLENLCAKVCKDFWALILPKGLCRTENTTAIAKIVTYYAVVF